jgi:hypothetical protein
MLFNASFYSKEHSQTPMLSRLERYNTLQHDSHYFLDKNTDNDDVDIVANYKYDRFYYGRKKSDKISNTTGTVAIIILYWEQ